MEIELLEHVVLIVHLIILLNYLAANINFRVSKTFFDIRSSQLLRNPTLSSTIDDEIVETHNYSTDLATSEFYHVHYS
jgi:hypothetical protein